MSGYIFYILFSAILVFVFALIYAIIICRKCWQQRQRERNDSSDVRVTLTSNLSSEELGFVPPSSPYQRRPLHNLPIHSLKEVSKLELADKQPLISCKDEINEKTSSNQKVNFKDTDNLYGADTPPKLAYKQPSLEKLLSSLDKSTLSLQWNNESDCQHDNSTDKFEIASLLAPNTTPEGGKTTKHDPGNFGVSLKSALVKLQEDNEENKNTSSISLTHTNENSLTLRGLKDFHANMSKNGSFSSKINSSNQSVYKSTTSLYYTDANSHFDNSSSNSS